MTEPMWMKIARSYIGLTEGPGEKDNPKVVAMYARAGHPEVHHDSVAWCAAYVGSCLADAGLKGTGTLWALDYAKWGQPMAPGVLAYGAVWTKTREGGGHVGFVAGYDTNSFWSLGGNQGDRVCIVKYPRSVIHSVRWPKSVALPTNIPKSVIVAGANKATSEV